ncbi:hypothetical protein CVM39_06425 [Pseudooceanicola antarcticus]|uniref:Uncharacterized protein n=1 Tax=Pseudooceanicola antarcticus TaxID=1247613 RepID=A0ABX4MRG9_9RHOB|nr:hypothetical protein CVM39_06425 [Pseudooceanicola antarcticus]
MSPQLVYFHDEAFTDQFINALRQLILNATARLSKATYGQFSPHYLRRAAGSLEFGGPSLVQ